MDSVGRKEDRAIMLTLGEKGDSSEIRACTRKGSTWFGRQPRWCKSEKTGVVPISESEGEYGLFRGQCKARTKKGLADL